MSKSKSTKRTVTRRTVSVVAVKAEQGRRKNNKARARKGEAKAKAKSWVLGGLDGKELEALTTPGTELTHAFSKRDVVVTSA